MTTYVGFDPDLHNPAFAFLWYDEARDRVEHVEVAVISCAKGLKGQEAAAATCAELRQVLKFAPAGAYYLAAEGQQLYGRGSKEDPADLFLIAHITGATVAVFTEFYRGQALEELTENYNGFYVERVWIPKPSEWKGQVPKDVHQARTLTKLRLPYETKAGYCVPTHWPVHWKHNLKKASDWKHAVDAIGLALWAREKHLQETRVASLRSKA